MGRSKRAQTSIWRPICRAPTGAPDAALSAAADEVEKAKIFSRGVGGKKVFAPQKNLANLNAIKQKFLVRSLEIKAGFSKSVRQQVPNPGLLRGFPAHHRPMSLFEGYGHADREPKGH
jgi:hypothetical protein